MLKKFYFIFSILFSVSLFAQIQLDTVETRNINSAVVYKRLSNSTIPLKVFFVRVDLTKNFIKVKTAKAMNMVKQFKDKAQLVGPIPFEQLSTIVLNNSTIEFPVDVAINGDFSTEEGRPYNIQVIDKQILQKPTNSTVISFGANNTAYIGRISLNANVVHTTKFTKVDSVIQIDGINGFRLGNQLWFYNQYIGSENWPDSLPRSGQNQWGPEIVIQPLSNWKINDTVKCIVNKISPLTLPDVNYRFSLGWAVLSQHRDNDDWLAKELIPGDTLRIIFKIDPVGNSGLQDPIEMIGGSPQIVKNGVQYVDQGYVDEGIFVDPTKPHHSKELHPRSAVGLSQDGRYLYLITVDGGNTNVSKGQTLYQFGDMLASNFGIYNALNLNGGEAATMIVEDQVVNSPSTGAEIPISNALLITHDINVHAEQEDIGKVNSYVLSQNYPNPFNPSTKIKFAIPKNEFTTLKIYDLLGREIKTLVNSNLENGIYSYEWNGTNNFNENVPSGTYLYKLTSGEFVKSMKMLLLK